MSDEVTIEVFDAEVVEIEVGPTVGDRGPKGDTGPANTLTIGTVTTGAAGSSASATITGTAPTQTLNLTIPRGTAGAAGDDGREVQLQVTSTHVQWRYAGEATWNNLVSLATITGPAGAAGVAGAAGAAGAAGSAGPANTLSIGTVTSGTSASATITGTAPSQTLNLVLPKGDTGSTGATGSQGPAGSTGAAGSAGPANTLSIGTVTTGAAGSSASATITGTAPTQTLNLTLPRGNTGASGGVSLGLVLALS